MKGNGYTVRFSPDMIDEICDEFSSNPHRYSSGDIIEALHCAQYIIPMGLEASVYKGYKQD